MENNVEFAKVHNMPNYALISLKALIKKDKINRFVYMKELCNLGSLFFPIIGVILKHVDKFLDKFDSPLLLCEPFY